MVFAAPSGTIGFAEAWWGIIFFTFQIYFDFSAYSDMAIGLARMLGFRLFENFNMPYIACSITEFWRRWHISLSTWIREYLYVPLGGNRVKPSRRYLNLWLCFLASGLWHGAAWTYIAWGAYNGLFLVLEKLFLLRFLDRLPRWTANLFTFAVVMVGWTVFRAHSLPQAGEFFAAMAQPGLASGKAPIFITPDHDHRRRDRRLRLRGAAPARVRPRCANGWRTDRRGVSPCRPRSRCFSSSRWERRSPIRSLPSSISASDMRLSSIRRWLRPAHIPALIGARNLVYVLGLSHLEHHGRRADPETALSHQQYDRRRVPGRRAGSVDGQPAQLQVPVARVARDRHAIADLQAGDPLEEPDLLFAAGHVRRAECHGRPRPAAVPEGVSGRLLLARPGAFHARRRRRGPEKSGKCRTSSRRAGRLFCT